LVRLSLGLPLGFECLESALGGFRIGTGNADEIPFTRDRHAGNLSGFRIVKTREGGAECRWTEHFSMQHARTLEIRCIAVLAGYEIACIHFRHGLAGYFPLRSRSEGRLRAHAVDQLLTVR